MPPRTKPPSYGEYVTLKEYMESRVHAVEKGIEVASQAMQERLSGMNEFRDTLKDQAGRFITRDEVDIKLEPIKKDIKDLQLSKAHIAGKASQAQANITMIIAVIGLMLGALSLILKLIG